MTDRNQEGIQQVADTILERVGFGEATQSDVPQQEQTEQCIHFACLYHTEDEKHWKRLNLHLEVVSWQEQRYHHSCGIAWHVHRLSTPHANDPANQVEYATLRQAHVLLLLLSVDSLAALKSDQELSHVLREKALEDRPAGCPALVGILVRPAAWKEMEIGPWGVILPANRRPLAMWRERDAACIEIAERVRTWIRRANTLLDRGMETA
ncbi:MAG: hypothetical protein ACRDIV_17665 [Ktedonobacteraceae bacterium]